MKTILVIDDDANLLRAIQSTLRWGGFHALAAEHSAAGLELAKSAAPDLIISDIHMELEDGYSLLRRLRRDRAIAAIPVILMTGKPGDAAMRRSMELGADDYLTKPFSSEELLAAIDARLTRHAAVRRPSEIRYRTLFESADDGILLLRLGKCVDCNPGALTIFAASREQLIGKSLADFSAQEQMDGKSTAATLNERIASALENQPQHSEWTLCRHSGEPFDAELTLKALPGSEPPILMAMVRDISQRKQFERSLSQSKDQLRALLDRLHSVAEEERTRLARDLHDDLGQLLTALQLELGGVERRLVQLPETPTKAELLEKLANSKRFAQRSHRFVREIASALRPSFLDGDLLRALRSEVLDAQKRSETVEFTFEGPAELPVLSEKQCTHLFRIFQEILSNIALHSQASQVRVQLAANERELHLRIEDNGKGLSQGDLDSLDSLGILGMRERAAALGGQIRFSARGSSGVRVTVSIPLSLPVA